MFVAWGTELGFLYNDPYAEILGAKHPRALGNRFQDIWSEIWTDIRPLIDAAMAGEAIYREDLPLVMNRRGYDEQTWFTFSYSPVRDDDGSVAGMFCAVSETTQEFRAEQALRRPTRRWNGASARRSPSARCWPISSRPPTRSCRCSIGEDRWLAFNRAATEELRRSTASGRGSATACSTALAHLPEQQAAVRSIWRPRARRRGVRRGRRVRRPGTRAPHLRDASFNTLRGDDGGVIGAYQFVNDVTERLHDQARLRQAEEALRHAQKLESLGQLTGGVAHDFNNLLQVFLNGVSLIERARRRVASRRTLDGMRRAVERGTDLTRHLLAFSRRQPVQSGADRPAPRILRACARC